jgi:hypothetical protein
MSREFEQRLEDWALWFHENKDRGRDYDKERAFLHKAIDGCIELLAIAAKDIQDVEGRPKRSNLLFTPSGVSVRGDVRFRE